MIEYENIGPSAYRRYAPGEKLIADPNDPAIKRALARGTLRPVGVARVGIKHTTVTPPSPAAGPGSELELDDVVEADHEDGGSS